MSRCTCPGIDVRANHEGGPLSYRGLFGPRTLCDPSIHDMRRIIDHAVPIQKRSVFLGEPFVPMVYLLVSDVIPYVAILERGDAEGTIPMLPAEIPPVRKALLYPVRGCCLYARDQLGQRQSAWGFEVEMNMIPGASSTEELSTAARNHGGNARIQPRAPLGIEPGPPLLGCPHQVDS
jgi:hypothetical protein